MDFASMDNDALTAALTDARKKAEDLFALTAPTIEQVNEVETLLASINSIESTQAERAAAVKDAEARFAAAKAAFSNDAAEADQAEDTEADDADTEADEAEVEADEADTDTDTEAEAEGDAQEGTVTASGVNYTTSQTIKPGSAARAVGRKVKRPEVKSSQEVVVTAAADVPQFSTGQTLGDMDTVAKALMNRAKGFSPYNARAAAAAYSASGGMPVLNKFGVASFGVEFDESLVATAGKDYSAVRTALRQTKDTLVASMAPGADPTLTAAGWCAPSENVYSYIADYVVDGLVTVPEVSAPRGGINITTGPVKISSEGAALDGFGFVQTEAQAEAGTVKDCETIVCPDFVDHRLDAIGYCYKIPLLTQKAYPEIITDALKYAGVLYAHKVNRRVISDMVALSAGITFSGYGASFTDALEALSLIAVAERRRWNIGENAVMSVKVPAFAKEVYRADMSRRNGVATDSINDGMIAAHFTDRRLDVEYVSDWQEVSVESGALILPGEFQVMMYPAGTFIKAVEDVISLSAVYDAASLSVNEYTGVFFEQGILVAKAGYASSLVTVPINTAGEQGALVLTGFGDESANGSF